MSSHEGQPRKRAAVAGLLTCLSVAATILGAENGPSVSQTLSALVAGLASGATAFLSAASADLKKTSLGQNERFGPIELRLGAVRPSS